MSIATLPSSQQLMQEIANYISGFGGYWSDWYVGIAADPQDRLFIDHSVDRNGAWIYRGCLSSREARSIEDYFLRLGMKGGAGGGDWSTTAVYAYKITSLTRE